VVEIVPRLLAKGLAGLSVVGDFGGVNAEEAEAELGVVVGEGGDRVAIRHMLDDGGEQAGGGAVRDDGEEEQEASEDESLHGASDGRR
jgi:hypothetical protein